MAQQGKHRLSRRTKIATGGIGLAIAVGALVVSVTAGSPGAANADPADRSLFVDITKVAPNVKAPAARRGASSGTFTIDCGRNENGHFNPDNFIAQPGVRNGAQHLHDYVGNLSTNADSNAESLAAGGTTCRNGDKSTYYWPVLRIDRGEEEQAAPSVSAAKEKRKQQQGQDRQAGQAQRIVCPDVASRLPDVPDQAQAEVDRNLTLLDTQIDEADKRLVSTKGQGGPNFVQNAILGPLRDKRVATIDRMAIAIGRSAAKPQGLDSLAPCSLGSGGAQPGDPGPKLPEEGDNNALPGNDGQIQRPVSVDLTFRGSPGGQVSAMPRFLRVLTGDAKVTKNGPKNARAAFSCTGFQDRVLLDKYPICPAGSKVLRIHDFPSCWDGKNLDSANHRDHIVFPGADGRCQAGFKTVPQLRVTLTYDIPREVQLAGQYKVDSFPEEKHNPFSDHDDFANVMSQRLMQRLVSCINLGRICRQ